MPKIVGRYVAFPRATESLPKTTGIISSRCGMLLFIFSASKSRCIKEYVIKVEIMSDGPLGCRPGTTTMVLEPILSISESIKFCAPCPNDITIIIAATPMTIPRIVKRDRDLWVWSPDMAVLSVYLKIIFRIRCSCGGCRPVCRFQLFRPTDGLLSARVLLCKFHELSILLSAYPQYKVFT